MNREWNMTELKLRSLTTREIIQHYGGVIEGHTAFRTGEHGNGYVEKMKFLQDPLVMREMGERIANRFVAKRDNIDIVAGPVHMGVVLAYAVAVQLRKPFTLTYKEMRTGADIHTGATFFHRAGAPKAGSRVLFIDDFIATGNDLRRNIAFFLSQQMRVAGVGVIGMRPIDLSNLHLDLHALETFSLWKKSAADCELCQSGVPLAHTNIRE